MNKTIRTLSFLTTLVLAAAVDSTAAFAQSAQQASPASPGAAPTPATPSPGPRRVYIANDDHTDYMWTADAETYGRVFVDLIDFHLRLAEQTKDAPPPLRARFNTDGSYWLREYEHRRGPEAFDRLMGKVKDGTISSPLTTLVSCYGAQPAEAVLRGMYYAGRLERRYDVRFPIAVAMENQTLPLGLASLFAGSGAKYSWRGVCGCASRIPNKELGARDREIYWYTGHDGQRVLMKWYSLGRMNIGGYWEAGNPASSIKAMETNANFMKRYVDPVTGETYKVFGLFGYGGDDLARKTGVAPSPPTPGAPWIQKVPSSPYTEHYHLQAAQLTTPERQVIVSNQQDFFEDFAATHGKTLDSHAVTYGNEWDLYSASMSETSARVKRSVEKLRTAELLATLVSLRNPDFMRIHEGERDVAFNALGLYWEHDWTADGPVTRGQRAGWQEVQAAQIEAYVDGLHHEGLVRLGGMIPRPENANRYFVVNPLSWARTEPADLPYNGSANVHVRDLTTGTDVPSQVVNLSGKKYLRILAAEVPPAGYKVYEVQGGATGDAAPAAAATPRGDGAFVFENGSVRLTVGADGSIRSFTDKALGDRELAASVAGARLNDIVPNSEEGEELRVENAGPVSVSLRARSAAGLERTTVYTLYKGSSRVDVRNEILQNFQDTRYWSFAFNLQRPSVYTEEVGAINLNKRKSDGGDYADRLARYDHVTVNHFADLVDASGAFGVTVSNADLSFARIGTSSNTSLDNATPQVNFLAGGQVDGPWLGIKEQNGQTRFLQRFAIRAHGAYDAAAAMRMSLEHQNPLVGFQVISDAKHPIADPYPETTYSLLSASNPDVVVWAVKPAEEGIDKGVIVRLWNVSDKPAETAVTLTPGVTAAVRTTHVETDLEPVRAQAAGRLDATLTRQQMQTYRFVPAARPTTAPTTAPASRPAP